ncbi:MAG: hypothetical protein AB8H86_23345 [Polyangiales bacterium]
MSKFLKAMSKIGLVSLSEDESKEVAESGGKELSMDEIDAILASEGAQQAPPPAAPPRKAPAAAPSPRRAAPVASAPSASASEAIVEGADFATIYSAAGTPEASYSAEKLLRVLDGLKAMDAVTRKTAVIAMDAADEEWTVADAVLDAERKIQALSNHTRTLEGQVQALDAESTAEKTRRDEYLAQATATIREKIMELETTLQQETATIVSQKVEIDSKLEAARASLTRESARLRAEAERLQEIPRTFAVARSSE